MRPVLIAAAAALVLASCAAQRTDAPTAVDEATTFTENATTTRPAEAPTEGTAMFERAAGEGGSISCDSPDDCDVEFSVDSVAVTDCELPGGMSGQDQVVYVDIGVQVRDQVHYSDALNIFDLGSWSAITEDGYTLRSLDIASGCDNRDLSLLTYGINAGEKVRNRIDFALPTNIDRIQLQPSELDGGGWSWPVE